MSIDMRSTLIDTCNKRTLTPYNLTGTSISPSPAGWKFLRYTSENREKWHSFSNLATVYPIDVWSTAIDARTIRSGVVFLITGSVRSFAKPAAAFEWRVWQSTSDQKQSTPASNEHRLTP
jgi:hypothetical protein